MQSSNSTRNQELKESSNNRASLIPSSLSKLNTVASGKPSHLPVSKTGFLFQKDSRSLMKSAIRAPNENRQNEENFTPLNNDNLTTDVKSLTITKNTDKSDTTNLKNKSRASLIPKPKGVKSHLPRPRQSFSAQKMPLNDHRTNGISKFKVPSISTRSLTRASTEFVLESLNKSFNETEERSKDLSVYTLQMDEIVNLKNENETLRTREGTFRFQIEKLESQLESANEQINNLKNEKDHQIDTILKEKDAYIKQKEEEMKRELEKIFTIRVNEILEQKEQEKQSLEYELTQKLDLLKTQHKQEMEAVEKKLQLESKQQNEALEQRQSALDDLQKQQENTLNEMKELKSLYNKSQTELQDTTQSLELLTQEHEKLQSQNKALSNELSNREQELDQNECSANELRAKVKKLQESLHLQETLRRKLHNELQDLKGNIRVYCRVRPVLPKEITSSPQKAVLEMNFPDQGKESQQIQVISSEKTYSGDREKKSEFKFDRVFSPRDTNMDIFKEISQLVRSASDGANVCILAYGQTGSGKTFTMLSPEDGMIPMAIRQLFETAQQLKETGWTYEYIGEFVEIYNETVYDLLMPCDKTTINNANKLTIKHDSTTRKAYLEGVTRKRLTSLEEVDQLMAIASENRFTAATNANERSSRSHSIFTIRIKGVNQGNIVGQEGPKTIEGVLNLVDLAGSERLNHSQAAGSRRTEAIAINTSLSALIDVIRALGNSSNSVMDQRPPSASKSKTTAVVKSSASSPNHIPYRNSKLTDLLQNSLCFDSKILMMVNISPCKAHESETINSLRFATNVNNTRVATNGSYDSQLKRLKI